MPTGSCATCGTVHTRPTVDAVADAIWTCDETHRGIHNEVTQLAGVTWQEQFIHAVQAIPDGVEFTVADLHGKIPDPPSTNHWGPAITVAASLGLCRPIDVQKSTLETTKGSRLLRWVRTVQSSRGAA